MKTRSRSVPELRAFETKTNKNEIPLQFASLIQMRLFKKLLLFLLLLGFVFILFIYFILFCYEMELVLFIYLTKIIYN